MLASLKELYAAYQKHPSVVTDTRQIKEGSIFFALKGGNFNGNEFAQNALEKGCAYAVIDEEAYNKGERFLLVKDVLRSMQELAAHHRKTLGIPIVGITGSNGKTTTKELIHAVLSKKYKTFATQGNFNNHIGVPLTLLSLNSEHEMAVVEMGANHIGEIAELCEISQPNYGLITNIGRAHLEGFGGAQGVIKAKNELYQYITKSNGTLFVNADDALLMDLSASIKRIAYGTSEKANFLGQLLSADPFVRLQCKSIAEPIQTHLPGKYNFENILAAACIGNFFKVEGKQIKEGLENYIPSNNRSQVITKGTNTILLDAYNANPTSMKAAIDNLYEMKAGNKMLILGDMLELGEESIKEHKQILEQLKEKGFNNVVLVGDHFSRIKAEVTGVQTFSRSENASEWLKKHPIQNTTILIKGSRGIKLEQLLEAFE